MGNHNGNNPLVSVVMPMRNAEDFVEEALVSVLQETQVPIEVVVVDDGSTDRSRAIVVGLADPRIRIVDGPCRGFSASINTGFAAAIGEIVMQCDADDFYPTDRIRFQANWLREHPEYAAVCGAFCTIDRKGHSVADLRAGTGLVDQDIDAELRKGITRTHFCTFATRRNVFNKLGLFREFFETGPDIDFQLKLGESFRIGYVARNAYFYRLHDASITHTQASRRRIFFEETAREFQQQRILSGLDDLQRGTPPVAPAAAHSSASSSGAQIQGMLIGKAWRDLHMGHRGLAVKGAWRALLTQPRNAGAWANLGKILVRVVRPK